MRLLGSILLAVGFLCGAYVSVSDVDRVRWGHYSACAAIMLAGMILLRLVRSAELRRSGDQHETDIAVLRASLARLIDKLSSFESAASDEDQLTVHRRIDAELTEDVAAFVDARESMVPKLGMQRYADIMSQFAHGERLINRAWSASADGYVDEVRSCIAAARSRMEQARALLAQT